MSTDTPYTERRQSRSLFLDVRDLRYHLTCRGDPARVSADRPALVMLHGWMDIGASFQFLVDSMKDDRFVIAPDWRGFGQSREPADKPADTYWYLDYLADLDRVLDTAVEQQLIQDAPIDLLGHSMGGNLVMLYAGVRPERIRRLINLEGFGLPQSNPADAPDTYRNWLDELRKPATLRSYESLDAVAKLLQRNNPLLSLTRARWLASRWAAESSPGTWELRANPAHKHTNPILYRKDEVLACWRRITAPVLWVEGSETNTAKWWGDRFPRDEFEARLGNVAKLERYIVEGAGHMLHHDQPERAASAIDAFLDR